MVGFGWHSPMPTPFSSDLASGGATLGGYGRLWGWNWGGGRRQQRLDGVPECDVKGRRFLHRTVQISAALLKIKWIPCFYNCKSEYEIMTFNIQVVWEESCYLWDDLPRHENISKVHVKDHADNLDEEILLVRGVVLVSAVISTQL